VADEAEPPMLPPFPCLGRFVRLDARVILLVGRPPDSRCAVPRRPERCLPPRGFTSRRRSLNLGVSQTDTERFGFKDTQRFFVPGSFSENIIFSHSTLSPCRGEFLVPNRRLEASSCQRSWSFWSVGTGRPEPVTPGDRLFPPTQRPVLSA